MLLNTLITIVKERLKMDEEKFIKLIELLKDEEDFTEEYLMSNKVSGIITSELIELLKSNNLIDIKYAYECEIKGGESEVADSLKEECNFCKSLLEDSEFHIVRELYTLKEQLIEEIENKEKKELEGTIDTLYLENFRQLKINLNNVVPFLGSGVSIPLGLPNWTGLISKMETGLPNPDDVEQFKDYLKVGDIFNALDILQNESLTYRTEEQIKTFIRDYINKHFRKELGKEYHNINDILNLNSDFYITTNYDNSLSQYKSKFSFPFILDDIKVMQELFSEKNQRIIHLHGNVEKKESMVVTEKDYERLYNDDKNKSILSGIMSQKSFLFIGFSFTDKYFMDMYQLLRTHIGGNHYIILADLHKHKAQQLIDKGLIPISINVNNLNTEKTFANEINTEYSQKFVNSLKVLIKNLLK
ncbi:SIR2 family protein [Niallia sp. RD1]|uniref:SIR2 family protein n=1 Tax=Niallia sp. RD1 TaxID=2962858 RepID=UPI0020C18D48|nr:SIR2 family protein [Niallia sp. RD1]UTI43738.1 SIR2 family protein [Niallia sp. RD1]